MSNLRVAVIFDNTLRPDTTGVYCRRALGQLVEVEHFLPTELGKLTRERFDLYLAIDDGLSYPVPAGLHPSAYWAIDTHLEFERELQRAQAADYVFAAQRDGGAQPRPHGDATASLPLRRVPHNHGRQQGPRQVCVHVRGGGGPRA